MSASATTSRRPARGFTILEIMTVVAILGALAAMIAPYFSTIVQSDDLAAAGVLASDALREAQSSAMSGKNNARFGVHFEQTKFVLFQGASYSPADANNAVHSLNGNVTVTAVTLSPGGACALPAGSGNCDVHFAGRKGAPTESGTIVLTGATGKTRTVTITAVGMVDVN